MQRVSPLYPNAVFAFVLLAASAVVGFWPSYFSRLTDADIHAHAHGLAMSAWVLLLITQAWLMRSGRRSVHRQLGKVSFLLVPVIVVATVSFANAGLQRGGLNPVKLHVLYIQAYLLFLFALTYALAMYNRRNPQVHARFMICTAITMIDPILARIIIFMIWMPEYVPYVQMITYGITDLVLVALILSNWRREFRLRVFPAVLGLFVLLQVPNFFVTGTDAWRSFAEWFAGLPLS